MNVHRIPHGSGTRCRQVIVGAMGITVLVAAGCRTGEWEKVRRDDSTDYSQRLQNDTREILERHPGGLDLTQCVAIARERNTKLLASRIESKIADVARKGAFSAFLPQVQVSYKDLRLSEAPLIQFGDTQVAMRDQDVQESSVQIVQPLFAPSAWLLYRTARRGADIAALLEERTGQMIELAVVSQFCECSALKEDLPRLDKELEAALQIKREAEAMASAGYVADAELAHARVLALESARALEAARLDFRAANGRLLKLLNLWPLAEIILNSRSLLDEVHSRYRISIPGGDSREIAAAELADIPVEEWMFHALICRKDMHIQDRTVALRKNETLRALAMFLPNLVGFTSYYKTSDSYTVNQEYWGSGLKASMSAFVGFRDVAAYLKAREDVKSSYVAREDAAMMILVQMLEAHNALKKSASALRVADAAADAADKNLASADAQYRGDLVSLSQLLQAQAEQFRALARRNSAAYLNAVAMYAFKNVAGGNIHLIAETQTEPVAGPEPVAPGTKRKPPLRQGDPQP